MTPRALARGLFRVIGIAKDKAANASSPPNPVFGSSVVSGVNPVPSMPERTFADRAMVLTVTVAVPE
jgi:hypothetical protein